MVTSDTVVSKASYGGGAFAVLSALTLTDWGILIGIFTAIATFALQVWWGHRRDKRDAELHKLALKGVIERRHEE